MSTTLDREVAFDYASSNRNGGSTILEIKMGMVDRGANVSWLSQYPGEKEILFAPLTGLEVVGRRVEKRVMVVEVRLNINLNAETIEQAKNTPPEQLSFPRHSPCTPLPRLLTIRG